MSQVYSLRVNAQRLQVFISISVEVICKLVTVTHQTHKIQTWKLILTCTHIPHTKRNSFVVINRVFYN
jgi:hypothetical protein